MQVLLKTSYLFLILSLFILHYLSLVSSVSDNGWFESEDLTEEHCGKRLIEYGSDTESRELAKPGEFPWHVAIFHTNTIGSLSYKCGGSLINQKVVITRAYCLYVNNSPISEKFVKIFLGMYNREHYDERDARAVQKIIIHDKFDARNIANDIGLIQLKEKATYGKLIQPICLWPATQTSLYYVENKRGTVPGWGRYGSFATTLHKASLAVVSASMCLEINPHHKGTALTTNSFCAGNKDLTDTCSGDNGGGLVFEQNGKWFLRGVLSLAGLPYYGSNVSFKDKVQCISKEYTTFVDVAQYLGWIEKQLKVLLARNCGKRLNKNVAYIASGYQSHPGNWGWHTAIYHRDGLTSSYKCGGSLINEFIVLTAAHCLFSYGKEITPGRVTVQLGKHNLNVIDPNTAEYQVDKVVVHPEYSAIDYQNDIALLILANHVTYTNFIQPVCLWPESKNDFSYVVNKRGYVVGWGLTEKNIVADALNEATMPVVDFFTCLKSNRDFFGAVLSDLNYCAGYRNGTSVCSGDSGGGMFFELNGSWTIRGLVSFSSVREDKDGCNANHFVVFTDVSQYLDWIAKYI